MSSSVPVLYLDHTAKMGGGEIALLNLMTALDRDRYEPVLVLAMEGPFANRARKAGIETHVIPLDTNIVNTRKDALGVSSLLRLRQAVHLMAYAMKIGKWASKRKVKLIHTNSLKSDIYGGLAGRMARIPVIWHVRDSIDSHYLPPVVAHVFRVLARRLPKVLVANSESTLKTLDPRKKPTAILYSGVNIIHDGVSDSAPAIDLAEIPTPSAPVVALVGRIAAWKGQHIFLRAAAEVLEKHPQAQFWVIGAPLFGEEAYEQSLVRLVDDLGIAANVKFWGYRDDVQRLLTFSTILVHSSVLGEPFGQVVIEGMAAGKPVIATNGGALPEIVLPGVTGYLVPMGESGPMADAISELLCDPVRAAEMGAAGQRRVQEKFTIRHTVTKAEQVYDSLLKDLSKPALWHESC